MPDRADPGHNPLSWRGSRSRGCRRIARDPPAPMPAPEPSPAEPPPAPEHLPMLQSKGGARADNDGGAPCSRWKFPAPGTPGSTVGRSPGRAAGRPRARRNSHPVPTPRRITPFFAAVAAPRAVRVPAARAVARGSQERAFDSRISGLRIDHRRLGAATGVLQRDRRTQARERRGARSGTASSPTVGRSSRSSPAIARPRAARWIATESKPSTWGRPDP